jgi:hypothetical protein
VTTIWSALVSIFSHTERTIHPGFAIALDFALAVVHFFFGILNARAASGYSYGRGNADIAVFLLVAGYVIFDGQYTETVANLVSEFFTFCSLPWPAETSTFDEGRQLQVLRMTISRELPTVTRLRMGMRMRSRASLRTTCRGL